MSQREKHPGIACFISGAFTLFFIGFIKFLQLGWFPWVAVVFFMTALVMFIIALFNRKELTFAVIGLLLAVGAGVWLFQ